MKNTGRQPPQLPNRVGGFAIRKLLRDPDNLDFRPCDPTMSVGAYQTTHSSKLSGSTGASSYVIPGRREWRAASPIPRDGWKARIDTDLIFLGALGATGHRQVITRFRSISLISPSICLLVHSGRSRYRPWGALLRSTIVPSVAGGVQSERKLNILR